MPDIHQQPDLLYVKDDGTFPNSQLPVLLYQSVIPALAHPDQWLETVFAQNNWLGFWRNGILSYDHYHSTSHEVLGIYRGHVSLRLGGPTGTTLTAHAGDVVVIPAGVAHNNLSASSDLCVAGAYPDGRTWDLLRGVSGERPAADRAIAQVPIPETDPLFGRQGPLVQHWQLPS